MLRWIIAWSRSSRSAPVFRMPSPCARSLPATVVRYRRTSNSSPITKER